MHPSLVESRARPELTEASPNPDGVMVNVEFDESDEKWRDEVGEQSKPQVLVEEVSTPVRLAAVCSEIQAIVVATITEHDDGANPRLGHLWGQQARLLSQLTMEQGEMTLSYGGSGGFKCKDVEDEEARLEGLRQEKEELQRQNAILNKRGLEVAAALTREVNLAEDERRAGRQAVERELHSLERERLKNRNDRERLQKDCATLRVELERHKKMSLDMERVRAEDLQRQEEALAALKQEFERKLEERSQQLQHQLLPAAQHYSPAMALGNQGFFSAVVRRQSLVIDLEQEKEERWKQSRCTETMSHVFLAWLRVALNSRSEKIRSRASSIVQAEEAMARKESALSSLALSLDTLDESLKQKEAEMEMCETEFTRKSRQLSQERKADEEFLLEREKEFKKMEAFVKEEHQRAEEAQRESLRALKEAEELRFELEAIKENRNTQDSRKLDIMRSSLASEIDELRRNMEAEKSCVLEREALLEAGKREVEAREVQLEEAWIKLDFRNEEVKAHEKRLKQSIDALDQRESVIQEIRHQTCQMSESLAIQQQRAAELDESLNECEKALADKEILLDSRHVQLNKLDRKLTSQKTALDSKEKSVAKASNELSSEIERIEHQAKQAKEELEMALETSRNDLQLKQTRIEQAEKHLTELKRRIKEEKAVCEALSLSLEEASAKEMAGREAVRHGKEELERSLAKIQELTADCAGNTQQLKDTQKRLEVQQQASSDERSKERKAFEMERSELMSKLKESEQSLLSFTEDSRAEAVRLESSIKAGRKDLLSLERICKAQEVQIESISVELDAARKDEARDLLAERAIADDLKSQLEHTRNQLKDVSRHMGACSKMHSNQLSALQEQLAEAKHDVEVVNVEMRDLTAEHVKQLKVSEQKAVALQKETSVLSDDLNKLRKDVSRSETDKRKLLTSCEEDKRELRRVMEELLQLKVQTEESARQRAEDEAVFASELAELKQYQSKSIELQEQNQKLEETISSSRRQVGESARLRDETKSELDSQLHQFEQYQQLSIQLQAQNQQLEAQVLSLANERDRKASELAVLVETKESEMSEIKEWMKLWSKGKDEDLNKMQTTCDAARDELSAAKLRISELRHCETDVIRLGDEVERLRDSEKAIAAEHEYSMKDLLHRYEVWEDHAESTSLEVQRLLKVNAEALKEKELADSAKVELERVNESMLYKLSLAEEKLMASEVGRLELEGRLKESMDNLEDNEQQLHLLEAAAEASCEHVDDLKKQLTSAVKDFEQCRILLEMCQNELQESRTSRMELTRKLTLKGEELANRDSKLQLKLKERTSRLRDCESSLKDQSDKAQGYKLRLEATVTERDKLNQMLGKLRKELKEIKKEGNIRLSELKEAQKLIEEKERAFTEVTQSLEHVSKEIAQSHEMHGKVVNNLEAEVEAAVSALRKEKEDHLAELERVAGEGELRIQDQWDSIREQNAENKLQKQRLSDQAASLESVRVALEKAESTAAEEAESISVRDALLRDAEERLKQRTKEEEERLMDMEENIVKREKVVLDKEMSIKVGSERLTEEKDSLAFESANLRTRQENVEEESLCLEESLKTLEERFEQESNATEITKRILQATQDGLERREVELSAKEKEIESAREELERKLDAAHKELEERHLQYNTWEREAMLKIDEAEAKLNANKEDLQRRVFEMDSRECEFSAAREAMQFAVEELEKRRQQLEERESSCNTIQDELVKLRLSLEVKQRKEEEDNSVAKSELYLEREKMKAELLQQSEQRATLEEMHQQAVKRKDDIEEEFVKLVQERDEMIKLRESEVQRNTHLQEENKKTQLELQLEWAEIEYKKAIILRDTAALEKERAELHFAKKQLGAREASIHDGTSKREKELALWAGELTKQGDALKAQASRLAQAHQSLRVREQLRSGTSKEDGIAEPSTEMPSSSSASSLMLQESMQMIEAERLSLASERAALKAVKDELVRERTELENHVKEGKTKVMVSPAESYDRALSYFSDVNGGIDWTSDFPNVSREMLESSLPPPPPTTSNHSHSKKRFGFNGEEKMEAAVVEETATAYGTTAHGGGLLSVLSQTDPSLCSRMIDFASTVAESMKAWQFTAASSAGFGRVEQQGHYHPIEWQDRNFDYYTIADHSNEENNSARSLMIELEAEKQLLRAERERLLTDRASLNRRMEALEVQVKDQTVTDAKAVQSPNDVTIMDDDTGVMEGMQQHDATATACVEEHEKEENVVVEIAQSTQLPPDNAPPVVLGDVGVTGDNIYDDGGGCVVTQENEKEEAIVVEDLSGTADNAELHQHRNNVMTETTEIYEDERAKSFSSNTSSYPSSIQIDRKEGKPQPSPPNDDRVELKEGEQETARGDIVMKAGADTLPTVDSVALSLGRIPPPDSGSRPTSPLLERGNDLIMNKYGPPFQEHDIPTTTSVLPCTAGASAAFKEEEGSSSSARMAIITTTAANDVVDGVATEQNEAKRHSSLSLPLDENEISSISHHPHHHVHYDGLVTDDATLEEVKLRLAGSSHDLQKGIGCREALLSGFGMASDGSLLCLSEPEEYSGRSWTSSSGEGGEYVEVKEAKEQKEEFDVVVERPATEFVEINKPPLIPTAAAAAVTQENMDDVSHQTMSCSPHQPLAPDPSLTEGDYEVDEERNRLRELMMSVDGLETPSEKTLSNVDEEEESSNSSLNLSLPSDWGEGQSEGWRGSPPPRHFEPLTTSVLNEPKSDLRSQLRELAHLVSDSSDRSGIKEETT